MAKMFYTTDEAAQKLGISGDQLKQLVADNRLREFRDGARVMFKVDQVDKISSDKKGGTASGTKAGSGGPLGLADSGVALTPADSHASDVISLSDTTMGSTSKDDTVVTGDTKAGSKPGQQVFKPGEVKSADTGAQTHIQSAIDDQLSLEGVGSGSGLLDLTRESDDTSLGAELLDEIYPGGDAKSGDSGVGSASGIFVEGNAGASGTGSADVSSASGLENIASTPAPIMVSEVGEGFDPTAGAFGGLAFASVLISIVSGLIALAFYWGITPDWLASLIKGGTTYVLIFGVVLLVVSAIFGMAGFFMGRSAR